MKKKNPKDPKNKKLAQNLSLFIPPQFLPSVHEDTPLICPEGRGNDTKKYIAEVEPFDIPPEWEEKPEEEINKELILTLENINQEQNIIMSRKSSHISKHDKNLKTRKSLKPKLESINSNKNNSSNNSTINNELSEEEKIKKLNQKWKDPMHEELINNLPLSFIKMNENNFLWLTPEEYILNEKIDDDIKRLYPKKDYLKMRENIKDFFKEVKAKQKEKERRQKEKQEKEEKERQEKERLEKEKQEKESKLKKRISKKVSKISIDSKKHEEIKNTLSQDDNNNINNINNTNNKEQTLEENKDNTLDDLLLDDSFIAKQNLYKEFMIHLNEKPEINILKIDERDETDEEYSSRVTETIEKQKETLEKYKAHRNKKEKKPIVQKPEDIPRNKVITNIPSNISVKYIVDKEKTIANSSQEQKNQVYSNISLISWLSSIFQFIIDLEITDCVTHNSIFQNIYPQKNGSPIYNPQGHYFVKLYFMGKPRKIEIDDRIPCSKDGEYIFPRCQNLCELWPALYTKALLKLNIFKVKHPSYWHNEENVDTNFIYAMTGYHAEIIQGLNNEEQIQNLLMHSLNDDNFLNKKKYLLCLNLFREQNSNNNENEEYYEDIVANFEKKKEEKNKMTLNDIIIEETINEGENENSTKFIDNNSKSDLLKTKFETAKNIRVDVKKGNTMINKQNVNKFNKSNKSVIHASPVKRKSAYQLVKNMIKSPGIIKAPQEGEKPINNNDNKISHKKILSRRTTRQKTVKLNIMEISDNKLDIIKNYAYSINDFFSNGNFNMDRLKPLNLDEIKRNLKQNTVVYKQLSEKEKHEYILERKKLREKQLTIKINKIDELRNEGKPFLIIKIKNNSIGQYDLNSILFYSEKEIFMAKKCMLNNWKYPPPEFFNDYFRRTDRLMQEEKKYNKELEERQNTIRTKYELNPKMEQDPKDLIVLNEPHKKLINDLDWTRIDYIENLLENDLKQYENTEEHIIKDPILKTSGGNWMSFPDFISLFNSFLVLHNPNALFNGSNICIDNNWKDYKIDCYEPLDDFMVLKFSNEEIENKDKMYESFIIFEPNNDKTLPSRNKIDNYIIIDILDDERNIVFKNITMNKFYSTHHVENLSGNKNYYIIIKGGIYQFGYVMQIYSEGHKITNMTYENYLIQTLRYQLFTTKLEHPLINNENFYLLTRLKIASTSVHEEGEENAEGTGCDVAEKNLGDIKIIFNVKYPIKHLKPFIKIFVQKDDEKNLKGKEIFSNEEIYLLEGNYIITIYFKNLSYPVKENSCDVDIVYSNSNYCIQQIETFEPYVINDEYIPNRHNLIFKELIFSPEKIYCSLGVELITRNNNEDELNKVETIKEEKSSENSENISQILNDKIKLDLELYHLSDETDENIPLINKKFTYNLRGNLLQKYSGFNKIIIPNFPIEGGTLPQENKKSNLNEAQTDQVQSQIPLPYLLICYIEDSFDVNNSVAKDKLNWNIKVFSSDKVTFVKEFSKEDKEKSLKNNWEENEPGRAEKAKTSRKKYFIEKTKREGGKLTMEQLEILNAKKDTNEPTLNKRGSVSQKKRRTRASITAMNKKSEEKKSDKDKNILKIKKVLPKSNDHYSKYIKNYLDYAYKKRTMKINTNILDQYLKTINNKELIDEKNQKIEKTMKDFNSITKTEMINTFYRNKAVDSNKKEEILSTFYKSDIDNRLLESNKLNDLMKNRNELKVQFKNRLNAKNTLSDIIKNHTLYNYDFNYMYESYKNTIEILGKTYPDEEKLYKILCNYKEEEIKKLINKYTNKDRNNAIKLIEEIENLELKVSENSIKKLKELIG